MSWVGCLLTDLELLILFAENSQILLKISVFPIFLTFMYLVALNLSKPTQLINVAEISHTRLRNRCRGAWKIWKNEWMYVVWQSKMRKLVLQKQNRTISNLKISIRPRKNSKHECFMILFFVCLFFRCNGTKIFEIPHCEGRIQRSVDSRWWGRVQACVCASQRAKNFMKLHFPIIFSHLSIYALKVAYKAQFMMSRNTKKV